MSNYIKLKNKITGKFYHSDSGDFSHGFMRAEVIKEKSPEHLLLKTIWENFDEIKVHGNGDKFNPSFTKGCLVKINHPTWDSPQTFICRRVYQNGNVSFHSAEIGSKDTFKLTGQTTIDFDFELLSR